ncbi:hypothetical protein RCL1_004145 [Eukaryota sp. TZLM3-RCL]
MSCFFPLLLVFVTIKVRAVALVVRYRKFDCLEPRDIRCLDRNITTALLYIPISFSLLLIVIGLDLVDFYGFIRIGTIALLITSILIFLFSLHALFTNSDVPALLVNVAGFSLPPAVHFLFNPSSFFFLALVVFSISLTSFLFIKDSWILVGSQIAALTGFHFYYFLLSFNVQDFILYSENLIPLFLLIILHCLNYCRNYLSLKHSEKPFD